MGDVLISVVMPVYNAQKYLDEAIQSILNQTYKNFEFIIINDGSSDESLNIIQKYKKQDERIVLINRQNKGLVYSLNEGIKISKGKFIARMDADDISLNNRLELQLKFMLENNLDICGGDFVYMDENGGDISISIVAKTKDEIAIAMTNTIAFAHPSVVIKTEFLLKNNLLYQDKKAEDIDLWARMYNFGAKFGNVNEIVLRYRVVSTSLSHSKDKLKILKQDAIETFNSFALQNKNQIIKSIDKALNQKLYNQRQFELIKAILTLRLGIKYIIMAFLRLNFICFTKGILSYIKFRL
ncbi:Undecaprenyl-phosphate 4-deoxy-4-formamido-L-arabinose transferase [Campylobacter majalis]|uniref:Undecaprenyl-phosphate 4-deoxy-4-formamido-L-arabinose transferase n=1 Tax=Campylobacter majalis TaxID=2790656 RepID=A0ABN7KAF5_9BACT|nr:glycosyltransferase [Campylobacter majalis]CAD7289460.1 Undecaprenyl-phosphate 4-deoxy-4-formamido-L-arabinose transferase [Campylobacter majalis]